MPEDKKIVDNSNLKELHASGYEIAEGEPDIRGWKIRTAQGVEIGKVKELLFDTVSLRVRYLAIHLNGKPLNIVSRDVLIPIGLAELHKKDNVVLFPEVTVAHFASLPPYKKGDVTIVTERAIRTVFAPSEGISYTDADFNDSDKFYNHEHFDEERIYRSRSQLHYQDNAIKNDRENKLPKRIISSDRPDNNIKESRVGKGPGRKLVNEQRQDGIFAPFQEGVIEIKEYLEVPLVSKETRIVEEVSVKKEIKEHDEKVKDSIRKTEIDVQKLKKEDLSKE